MTDSLRFTAVYEPAENGWVQARLAELPGVITAAPSRAEAEEMLLDAMREYLLSFVSPSVVPPRPQDDSTTLEVTFSTPAA